MWASSRLCDPMNAASSSRDGGGGGGDGTHYGHLGLQKWKGEGLLLNMLTINNRFKGWLSQPT